MPAYAASTAQAPTRAIWLSSGLDDSYSAQLTARFLNASVSPVHIVWDPEDGTIVQMASAASTARYSGIPRDLRDGSVLIMATRRPPFTAHACLGLSEIMEYLNGLCVPRVFPSGSPPPGGQSVGLSPGHYAFNCGAIDVDRVLRS